MPPADRDFAGYGPHPRDAAWPGGARFAVNVEDGATLSLDSSDERDESGPETARRTRPIPA